MKHKSLIIESEIGKRIKKIRLEKQITLEKLAAQTGFTKGYLSKVEKSVKAPPVSTLGTIAYVLNVTISSLLGEETTATPICLVKRDERSPIARDGTRFGYSYEAVAHKFTNKMMEPFILTLPAHQKNRTLSQHQGQEILFVLEGTMKFLHGMEQFIVEEGDCIYFDSGIPHFGESVGDKMVKCFMVIFNPRSR
jgi:transcriptional regulator with XRE-family HTH domain